MGDNERKKPSSLRMRVDRARKTYGRKSSPVPMVVAGVFLVLFLIGMYVALGGSGGPSRTGTRDTATSTRPETVAPPVASRPGPAATQPKNAFQVVFYAKQKRRKDPDGALRMLKDGAAKFGNTPELYQGMALAVDEKMVKAGKGSAAYKQLAGDKLQYLEKALALVEGGKGWEQDPLHNKTTNLNTSIQQARKAAGQ